MPEPSPSLSTLTCLGAIAVELAPGRAAAVDSLSREQAGALAELLARDLAKFAPAAARLDLVLVAGLFDPVELLRPGWPLHAELERLCALAPGLGPRVISFGAAAGSGDAAGELPSVLRPDSEFANGNLRLLPWLLRGEQTIVATVAEQFEAGLLESGMAAADTALVIQTGIAVPVEHVRYLTVHDLAAMMALQYEHVGLAALWPLIETALLTPDQDAWLDAPPEPLARYSEGGVRMALLDFDAWVDGGFAPAGTDATRLGRAFERFEMRQRQLAALFEAHGLPVTYDHCPSGRDPRAVLRA